MCADWTGHDEQWPVFWHASEERHAHSYSIPASTQAHTSMVSASPAMLIAEAAVSTESAETGRQPCTGVAWLQFFIQSGRGQPLRQCLHLRGVAPGIPQESTRSSIVVWFHTGTHRILSKCRHTSDKSEDSCHRHWKPDFGFGDQHYRHRHADTWMASNEPLHRHSYLRGS